MKNAPINEPSVFTEVQPYRKMGLVTVNGKAFLTPQEGDKVRVSVRKVADAVEVREGGLLCFW